jgi:hypothetical protein
MKAIFTLYRACNHKVNFDDITLNELKEKIKAFETLYGNTPKIDLYQSGLYGENKNGSYTLTSDYYDRMFSERIEFTIGSKRLVDKDGNKIIFRDGKISGILYYI